jgi:leader peptidase (prepilin peptidase)/N-methyltransferase
MLANGFPAAFWVCAAAGLGLVVGSFLNVLVLRLPVMLEREWLREARATLDLPPDADAAAFNLAWPPSRCGSCGHAIRWRHNLPLLGWLMLRGRCADCGARIAWRYPAVELGCALLSAALVAQLGPTAWCAGELLLLWGLIALALIDFDTTLLPDALTLPLLWLGLLLHALLEPAGLQQALWGAALGYLSLWTIYHLFRLATGKEGMGHGDFKLLALLGAWFGALALLPLILLSAVVGAVVGIGLQLGGLAERGKPIPFGPFLAGAGLLALYLGPQRLVGWVLPGMA